MSKSFAAGGHPAEIPEYSVSIVNRTLPSNYLVAIQEAIGCSCWGSHYLRSDAGYDWKPRQEFAAPNVVAPVS